MKIAMLTLAALMAIIHLDGNAEEGCLLNGAFVPGDPELIQGTNSPDIIDCRTSHVRHNIYGSGGGDTIWGSHHGDFIAGGGGGDTIHGGNGDDQIDGGAENDFINGNAGNDVIFGGVGSAPASGVGCTLQAAVFIAKGSSYLTKGGSGDDTIYGGDGDDCIDAGSGEDMVFGEAGDDTLEGGNHSDWLEGGAGKDYMDGGWHSDTCVGDTHNTFISCEVEEESPYCEINCGGGSDPFCGDLVCDIAIGENNCSCAADCGQPSITEMSCADNMDNDCDFDVDCDDADCDSDGACFFGCTSVGDWCDSNSDCCSNKCKGKSGSKTCK